MKMEMERWLADNSVDITSDPLYDRYVLLQCGQWFLETVPVFRTYCVPGPLSRSCPSSSDDQCQVIAYIPLAVVR